MKMVIDILEEDYKFIRDLQSLIIGGRGCGKTIQYRVVNAIKNGTPLPKGHGRLKDIDRVERLLDLDKPDNAIAQVLKNLIESVPTIVEAESEE